VVSKTIRSAVSSVLPAVPGPALHSALPRSGGRASSPEASERVAAIDALAVAVRAALDAIALPLAGAAAAFVKLRAWHPFGHARIEDHARERFGRSGRWVRDLATLGAAIERFPAIAEALTGADGGSPIGRVAAILVARGAAHGPVDEWIALARRRGVRELRRAIRARREATTSTSDAAAESDSEEVRVLVRLPVPSPVVRAFDEALDLYRAVEGREASVTSFVEALVGEARSARPAAGTPLVSPLVHGMDTAIVEEALRRSTGAWESLGAPPAAEALAETEALAGSSEALVAAASSLRRLRELEAVAGFGGAVELDRQISALVALENELEVRLGALLAEMGERGAWSRLRFASVGHYAEERLGLSRSRAGERASLARALRRLPRLDAACATGRLTMEAAAIIHRLIGDGPVPVEVEEAWIRHADDATIKRLRDEARAIGRYRSRGVRDRTTGPPRPLEDTTWHAALRRECGTASGRVMEFGRLALGIGTADGDARGNEPRDSGGGVGDADVFRALPPEPDVFLRLRLPVDLALSLVTAIESARATLEKAAASSPWDAPWQRDEPTPAEWAARIAFVRARRVPMWAGLLALLEEFVGTWDSDAAAPEGRDDRIFVRDGWRCMAPGCTSRRHLEDHHVVYRSRGGSNDTHNRVTLCRFHHQRGEHGGLLVVRGAAPLGLAWRLGRPDVAAAYRNEMRTEGAYGAGAG